MKLIIFAADPRKPSVDFGNFYFSGSTGARRVPVIRAETTIAVIIGRCKLKNKKVFIMIEPSPVRAILPLTIAEPEDGWLPVYRPVAHSLASAP